MAAGSRARQLVWFAGLWAASVAVLGVVALLLRGLITALT